MAPFRPLRRRPSGRFGWIEGWTRLEDRFYAVTAERRRELLDKTREKLARNLVPDHQVLKDFDAITRRRIRPSSLIHMARTHKVRRVWRLRDGLAGFRRVGWEGAEYITSKWLVMQRWLPQRVLSLVLVAQALAFNPIRRLERAAAAARAMQYRFPAILIPLIEGILSTPTDVVKVNRAGVGFAHMQPWRVAPEPVRGPDVVTVNLLPFALAAVLFLSVVFPAHAQAGISLAAIAAGGVWEARTTGNAQNGGAFVTGASGTDFSQQDAPQYALTGVTSAGAGNVVLSASAAADMVGNVGYVVSGTNFTAGTVTAFFQVTSVVAGVSITFSTNVAGTAISTGVGANGVINIGGANADPAIIAANLVAGHTVYQKSGTYSITSASTNVAGGCPSIGVRSLWEGYNATRGDLGTKPLLNASGISTATLFALAAADTSVQNMSCDGNDLTSIRGIAFTSGGRAFVRLCDVIDCTNNGIHVAVINDTRIIRSSVSGSTTTGGGMVIVTRTLVFASVSADNEVAGIETVSDATTLSYCLLDSNSGATSDGFNAINRGHIWINSTAYGNGRSGFRQNTTSVPAIFAVNCIAEGNGAYGYEAVVSYLQSCASYNNTSGRQTGALLDQNPITGSASFFTNAAAGDFSLNTNAGGGALARAAGIPGVFPGGLTTGYLDVGAAQHRDSQVIMARVFTGM